MIHTLINDKTNEKKIDITKDPVTYYTLVDLIKSITPEQVEKVRTVIAHIGKERESIAKLSATLTTVASQFHEEQIHNTRRKGVAIGQAENDGTEDVYNFRDHNYIILLASMFANISNVYAMFAGFANDLIPPKVLTVKKRVEGMPESFEEFNGLFQEMQFNGGSVQNYAMTLAILYNSFDAPSNLGKELYKVMEPFYKYLLQVHTKDGVRIINNPVVTNVAMHIFENIDSHGEVKKDGDTSKISAYTMRKAETLAAAISNEVVQDFMKDPDKLQYLVRVALTDIANIIMDLNKIFAENESKLRKVISNLRPEYLGKDAMPTVALRSIDSIKYSSIVYNEPVQQTEGKLAARMRDETIGKIAEMIVTPNIDFSSIVEYVIDRKAELNKFYYEENSFYVCKIGDGNPFLGQAPGALYIEPSERPMGKLDEILGSGFEDIRNFFGSIEHAAKFHDLFVATSPSKTADKSNVLMIGPMGCGKTEVLRAVGADKGSIGVFAQGSDFLTCWKGEAEKNPKRLFQEGLNLSRESGRHVHFLIDEIDSLLNNDRDLSGNNNLTLEFQILMDGVVRYPNLSVWGATNHVQRIPMPMIRRFNKVIIVGELDRSDRATLLQKFTSYMPIAANVGDSDWENWSVKLEGATGDVMRKISDHVWRTKMSEFVSAKPEQAEEMVKLLNMNGKFIIDEFGSDKRIEFKKALSKYVIITADDISQSIDDNLLNLGIRSEIQTATATYRAAKDYLEAAKEGIKEAAKC